MSRTLSLLVAALCWAGLSAPSAAEGRLDKFRASGEIRLGFPDASPPFGFLDQDAKPVGYSLGICEHVARRLKLNLGLPKLDIRHVPVTSAMRIPLINNGTIDLECGTASNLPERHALVAFAPTTFVAQAVLVTRKATPVDVNDIASFRSKAIAAQAGGETQRIVTRISVRDKLDIRVVPAKDTGEVFLLLETGRVAGTINDDALAHATVAGAKHPEEFTIGTKGLEFSPYGIVEPKDDPDFKAAVDRAVVELIQDGTVAQLYTKYFQSPLPPRGVNLDLPMSDVLKRALARPTDSGNEADYREGPAR